MGRRKSGIIKSLIVCLMTAAVIGGGIWVAVDKAETVKGWFGINKEKPSEKPPIGPDKPLTYTITFDIEGEKTTKTVVTGGAIVPPNPPIKEGYVFVGWLLNNSLIDDFSLISVTNDMTFEAIYEEEYTLLPFNIDENGVIESYIENEDEVIIPATYSRNYRGQAIVGEDNFIVGLGRASLSLKKFSSIQILANIERIEKDAFHSCRNLSMLELPASVNYIEYSAFYNCNRLTKIVLNSTTPPTLEKEIYDLPSSCLFFVPDESIELYKATDIWRVYEDRIFNLSEKDLEIEGVLLDFSIEGSEIMSYTGSDENIVVPATYSRNVRGQAIEGTDNEITSINNHVFWYNSNIRSVKISEGIKTLGNQIFSGCYNITSIELPDTLEYMGTSSFSVCRKLTQIVIPKNVNNISGLMFQKSTLFEKIIMDAVIPPTTKNIGELQSKIQIFVPDESFDDYITSEYWRAVASRIHKVSELEEPTESIVEIEKTFENKADFEAWLQVQVLVDNFKVTATFISALAGEEFMTCSSLEDYQQYSNCVKADSPVTFNGKIQVTNT